MKRGLLCTAVLLAVGCGMSRAEEIAIGKAAPEFKAKGVDGKEYNLGSIKEAKATVVVFTCNGCPVAKAYEDRFVEFAKKYAGKGVKFIAIDSNSGDDLKEMKQRSEEKSFCFPYAKDESDAAKAFGAEVTPHLFIIDKDGKIAYHGAFDDDQKSPKNHYVADAVDALLAGKAVKTTSTKAFGCGIH